MFQERDSMPSDAIMPSFLHLGGGDITYIKYLFY